jgi:hypothetical protein
MLGLWNRLNSALSGGADLLPPSGSVDVMV